MQRPFKKANELIIDKGNKYKTIRFYIYLHLYKT